MWDTPQDKFLKKKKKSMASEGKEVGGECCRVKETKDT